MSKPRVKVTLKSKDGNDLVEGGPVSLGDGYCKFPFIYKDKEYDDGVCYKGKAGNYWCATKVDEKTNNTEEEEITDQGCSSSDIDRTANLFLLIGISIIFSTIITQKRK